MPTFVQIVRDGIMVLLMGLLIGVEREHSQRPEEPLYAGIRTFPLIALVGFLSGLSARAGAVWVLPVALAGVSAIAVAAYIVKAQGAHKGATTELVAILAFLFGTLTAFGYLIPAAIFAVITTLVLSLKEPLHTLAERIQKTEIYAILKFAIVTVIILPLLPNRPLGPYHVLNPRLIWLMVVLISAISMVSYVLMRFLGTHRGLALTGFLGGLASSTAATFGLSQEARESGPGSMRDFALGILIACTVMFGRVLIIAGVLNAALARGLGLPVAIPTIVGGAVAFAWWMQKNSDGDAAFRIQNPMDLRRALEFALIFAVVLFVSRVSERYLGSTGLYLTAAVAGIVDVDAITISGARLAQENIVTASTASASILLACAVNTVVKAGIAIWIGPRPLRRYVIPVFIALALTSFLAFVVLARA